MVVFKEQGMTKIRFAEDNKIHINSATSYLENGVVPEWPILIRICDKYKLSPYWLIIGKGPKKLFEKDEGPEESEKIFETAQIEKEDAPIIPVTDKQFYQDIIRMLTENQRSLADEMRRCIHKQENMEARLERLKSPQALGYEIREGKKTPTINESKT